MSKEICISTTPHETRLAILEDEQLTEIYYERENEYTLAGSIYKGRVTRVLPGMQSAFVDVGLERDAFLYVTDFLEEQEDSADFERMPGNGRAEEAPVREPNEARAAQSAEPVALPEEGKPSRRNSAPAEEFEDGTRRWRGRRGRRRGPRPGGAQEPPAPNRAEPPIFTEPERVEKPDGAHTSPQSLPGESISKYGGQGAPKASAPEAPRPQTYPGASSSRPSTLIEQPLQWSGGSMLPGESISRYRGEPEAGTETPAASFAADPTARHFAEQESAEKEPEVQGPSETWIPLPGEAAPAETLEHLPAAEEKPIPAAAAEFEPEGASASYRVDPSALSEFRFSAPVAEPDLAEETEQFPVIPEFEQVAAAKRAPDINEGSEESTDELPDSSVAMGFVEEEEVSDEEEYDFTPFYSQSEDPDLEDLEEETLDQHVAAGAELEEMVRDAHLDQRVNDDGSVLTQGEDEDEDEELDEETADGEADAESEMAPAAPAGQPVRREREDHRRGGRGGRNDSRRRHNGRRSMAPPSSLPVISELLKQGQEILVQIAKEPIAKKGARITSHIALPGRFLVFMPTVNHVGVSRKIASDEERQRLKRILISEKGTASGGFIVRTAADGAGEEDLRADIRFLISLWTEIKQRSDAAKAPALIYHDLNLVERVLRDQVSDNFSTIWVDSEAEYERIVRFLERFQPSLVRRAKLYTKETPLFEHFGIQDEITKALRSKVWLKSGGSIVINQTEALVAIDINTGKYVGKTTRLEDTILKTNLDAIPEIVRQIRLRDLGGIIVIDFIDMDERKNRNKVMQALEEALKADRAPSKVLQFNDFGLVAITRKRVKQSLERTLSTQCSICAGTGMVKSSATVCNEIFVEMRKMQRHLERHDVLLRVNPEVVKTLKANNGRWLTELEEMTGKTIIVKSDPALHPEQFDIH